MCRPIATIDVGAIHEAKGATAIQGVDGGVVYLTGDGELHFLRGAAH